MESHDTSSSPLLTARVRVPEHAVYRTFEAETLLLNLKTGQYHGLNETGGKMLLLLEEGRTVGEAIAALAAEYDEDAAEIESDLTDFCEALAKRGLVEFL